MCDEACSEVVLKVVTTASGWMVPSAFFKARVLNIKWSWLTVEVACSETISWDSPSLLTEISRVARSACRLSVDSPVTMTSSGAMLV